MPPLTAKDKRTIRIASICVGVYLGVFYGVQGWNYLEARRLELDALALETQMIRKEIVGEQIKAVQLEKLRGELLLKPRRLKQNTLVAEATAAIQAAAQKHGFGLAPGKESGVLRTGREIASLQLGGKGPLQAAIGFVDSLPRLGFPLSVETIQLQSAGKPEQVTLAVRATVLDPYAWDITPQPQAPATPAEAPTANSAKPDDKPAGEEAVGPNGATPAGEPKTTTTTATTAEAAAPNGAAPAGESVPVNAPKTPATAPPEGTKVSPTAPTILRGTTTPQGETP